MGQARLTYDRSTSGMLTTCIEISQDGKPWSNMFDGTYRRAS
jgi:hypothetical protein